MKKVYEHPQVIVEEFAPNEYVAACGDSGTTYLFSCDAKRGPLYYYPNGKDKRATLLGLSYHPCGEKHEADSQNPFYDGFVDYNLNGKEDTGEAVIVWRGPKNNNGHATTNLDKNSWETAKS